MKRRRSVFCRRAALPKGMMSRRFSVSFFAGICTRHSAGSSQKLDGVKTGVGGAHFVAARGFLRTDELVVQFDPKSIGSSELMHDVRLMACSYAVTTHVIAIIRHGALVGGRVAFRKYDNDSDSRRRGTYELTNARRLWVRCTMIAITTENSALHQATIAFRARARETVDIRSPPRRAEC